VKIASFNEAEIHENLCFFAQCLQRVDKALRGTRSTRFFVEFITIVPQDHLVRKIENAIDFSFIYDLVKDRYSPDQGRPSIDPVVLIKMVSWKDLSIQIIQDQISMGVI
jgi:hypothetical protein